VSGGENKISELLRHEGIPAVENKPNGFKPAGTAGIRPPERHLPAMGSCGQCGTNIESIGKPALGGGKTTLEPSG
jgi:hypothetical protein